MTAIKPVLLYNNGCHLTQRLGQITRSECVLVLFHQLGMVFDMQAEPKAENGSHLYAKYWSPLWKSLGGEKASFCIFIFISSVWKVHETRPCRVSCLTHSQKAQLTRFRVLTANRAAVINHQKGSAVNWSTFLVPYLKKKTSGEELRSPTHFHHNLKFHLVLFLVFQTVRFITQWPWSSPRRCK